VADRVDAAAIAWTAGSDESATAAIAVRPEDSPDLLGMPRNVASDEVVPDPETALVPLCGRLKVAALGISCNVA